MTPSPAQILQALLANPIDLANVKSVTTQDVTYVSLSEDNPELEKYLPWTGTNRGPESIVRAFEGIGRAWETKAAKVRDGKIHYVQFIEDTFGTSGTLGRPGA